MAHRPGPDEVTPDWAIPSRGILRNFPIDKIPPDGLFDGLNVIVRGGRLQTRPGLTLFSAENLGARPSGAFHSASLAAGAFQSDFVQGGAFQTKAEAPGGVLFAGTDIGLWAHIAGAWADKTGSTVLTGNSAAPVRFTSIEINNTIQTIATNGINIPQKWDQAAVTFSDVVGSPPLFSDIATVLDRIIGIIPPFTIRWGNALDIGTWPALNFRTLSDTSDPLRAIRNLGTQGAAIYKQRSLWVGLALGATDATFFAFELRFTVDGPAGANAVVDADGVHFYLTDTGRIGSFDGFRHRWVADGVWPLIRADIDTSNANLSFGVYDPLTGDVTFYYPRIGDNGIIKGVVHLSPPKPEEGIGDFIGFAGSLEVPVSAGIDQRSGTRDVVLFRSDDFKSYKHTEDADDAGTAFTGFWHTGLRGSFPGFMFRLDNIVTLAERGAGFGTLTIAPVSSDLLESTGGTIGTGKSIDLTKTPVRELIGFDVRARYLGLRYSFTTPIKLRYRGGRGTARRIE